MVKQQNIKIYFAGSIRGGRRQKNTYTNIIALLKKQATVLTEHIGDKKLSSKGENTLSDKQIYTRDLNWLKASDAVVAEVTTPSLGVGYEIGKMETQKPILCLYKQQKEKRLSAMLSGNSNIQVKTYKTLKDLENILQGFLSNLKTP